MKRKEKKRKKEEVAVSRETMKQINQWEGGMEMKKTVGRCDVGGALHAITGYLQHLEQAV